MTKYRYHIVDVFTDTGNSNTPHNANGVGWYFNNNDSWGFAAQGDTIQRNKCDMAATNPDQRLCWETFANNTGGYRCGAIVGLGNKTNFDRLIYQAN